MMTSESNLSITISFEDAEHEDSESPFKYGACKGLTIRISFENNLSSKTNCGRN